MAEHDLSEAMVQHPFLHGLAQSHIGVLRDCASLLKLKEGEFLLREGHAARAFYLLSEGRISLELDVPPRGTLRIQTIGPGEVLGWSWFVSPHRWRFTGRALTPATTIALDAVCLRERCSSDHDLGFAVLERLAYTMEERLEATRLQLLDLYTTSAAGTE
jgi:CRP/FNR family transcriptional regulator, cyclic AMP receptor protein